MGDPDLRSDEMELLRTPGVYVKSIAFEGIITNKRILLIDRTKNLLPPKEIPLATIKDVEGGENAIRDPVVTVTVITKSGESRQMVLTFFGKAEDYRSRERDEWVKTLKVNVSGSFEQVIRKGTPDFDQPQRRSEPPLPSRVEVTRAPVPPAIVRSLAKKEVDSIHPIKKIIENSPSKMPAPSKIPDGPSPGFGTFCTRCGNKVPEGSGFCNRCGSSIIQPGSTASVTPAVPEYRAPVQPTADREIQTVEQLFNRSSDKVPADPPRSVPPEPAVQRPAQRPYSPLYDNPPEPVETPAPAPASIPSPAPAGTPSPKKPAKKPLIPRLFSPKELTQSPLNRAPAPAAASPPPQKPLQASRMPGKKVFLAIGVIILIIAIVVAGVVFVYPMLSASGSSPSGSAKGVPATTATPSATSTPVSSGTIVVRETTAAAGAPATGVYAHVNYIGSWKGTYGMPSDLQKIELSGDHYYAILNATGTVQATFEKLDGSTRHDLVVEIYKNGGLLTTGKTSEGFGKVTVSADATTGVAQAVKTVAGTVTTTSKSLTNVTAVKTTSSSVTGVTPVKTTVPVTTAKA